MRDGSRSSRTTNLICGFGRVGQQVARDFIAPTSTSVVIDDNVEQREMMEEMGVLYLHGPAADDALLNRRRHQRARAVIACVDSDAENIFITLSARELNPEIEIVARASQESSERKLLRAGADDVISLTRPAAGQWRRSRSARSARSARPTSPATRGRAMPIPGAAPRDG